MVKKAAHWNQSKSSPWLHYQSKTLLLLFLIICFIFSQLWLRIHPVCGGLLPRCPLTSTRPGCKNYEHRSDVQVSTSQSAAELFINCREVEVFTTAHVAVTHNCGVATPPLPPLLPQLYPSAPWEFFHEVKGTSGVLQMTGETPSHVPMMKQRAGVSQVPSFPQTLCWRGRALPKWNPNGRERHACHFVAQWGQIW